MAVKSVLVLLACCACLSLASLPSADAANRKMLNLNKGNLHVPEINVAVAQAQASAAATSAAFNHAPNLILNTPNKHLDNKGGVVVQPVQVSHPAPVVLSTPVVHPSGCNSAAAADASAGAVSSGSGGVAFTNTETAAIAGSSNSGCGAFASSKATSFASSGK